MPHRVKIRAVSRRRVPALFDGGRECMWVDDVLNGVGRYMALCGSSGRDKKRIDCLPTTNLVNLKSIP